MQGIDTLCQTYIITFHNLGWANKDSVLFNGKCVSELPKALTARLNLLPDIGH